MKLQRELFSRRLRDFVVGAWHVLEPDNPFVHGWHIDAICDHLEAVTRGHLRRLIINIAPRHCKSMLVSVFWPAWEWLHNPHVRFLYTSYGMDLATRDSVKTRNVIQSRWYQERWGHLFQLTGDMNLKTRYENDKRGYRLSTSVTGAITGEGGDRLVLDDPHNALEAESEVERQKVKDFVDRSWSSRVNNPATVSKVVVHQRLHEEDITSHLMAKEAGWEHLILPTEYKPVTRIWFNGGTDPRKEEDELLWPQRFGPTEVKEAKVDLGDHGYIAQHQQDPKGRPGEMFDVPTMMQFEVSAWPDYGHYGRFYDLASTTKKTSKRTAGYLVCKTSDKHYYIGKAMVGKWRPEKRNELIKEYSKRDMSMVKTYKLGIFKRLGIEHEGGSSGEDQEFFMTKEFLAGLPVEFIPVSGDKAVRADSLAAAANLGLVHVVNDGTWNVETLYDELRSFPNGTYKDQVDSLSLGFNYFAQKTVVRPGPKVDEGRAPQQEQDWRSQLPGEGWRNNIPSISGNGSGW